MTAFVKPTLLANAIEAQFAVPRVATKRLKFKTTNGKRKIVVSSNWLPLFNFNAGDDMTTRSLGSGKGLVAELVTDLFTPDKGTKKVYKRTYPKRKNNPIETLVEISAKKIIDKSFLFNASGVHVKFEANKLTFTPITDFKDEVISNIKFENRYSIFAACSSGVDLHLMEQEHGFNTHSLAEWRPNERRNKRDYSETGALAALRNLKSGIKNLFNEDITFISATMLEKAVKGDPAMVFMASPQCDDYTPLKTKKMKADHVEDLSSSMDMAFDMLRVGMAVQAPIIKFEQVQGWYKSDAYKILSLRLRKLGYKENLLVANASDYNGLTNRTRGYCVFTLLDVPFEFEAASGQSEDSIWPIVEKHLPECRDVTHSKSLQDGKRIGRLRTITPDSTKSPTILKSQSRCAKDSMVIEQDGRLIWPSEPLVKELMGVPNFKTDCVSQEFAYEIIGQSVDAQLHSSVARSVKKHIDLYFSELEKKAA